MALLSRLPVSLHKALIVSKFPSRLFSSTTRAAAADTIASAPGTTAASTSITHTNTEPLRILFCGSDAFSIESLRALHTAHQQDPSFIDAIHVVHRPAKPTGRGLKTLREVPIAPFASSLHLPTHPLNTFTSWTPPFTYNLIIAVSFGLLIPPRILSLAPHGGLNLHPSLLPDLRGSAPIQHAILRQRNFTGVSVQTLHPRRFDAGVVLRQTAPPGIPIGLDETRADLEARLASEGAAILLDVLRAGLHRAPITEGGYSTAAAAAAAAGEGEPAPKLTKQDHFVDFATMTLDRVRAGVRALGDVWCVLPNGERLVVHGVEAVDAFAGGDQHGYDQSPGHSRGHGHSQQHQATLWYNPTLNAPLFRAACGRVGLITSSTYPGGKTGRGNAKVAKVLDSLSVDG